MTHSLTLEPSEYKQLIDGKPFLITRLDCEVGDDLLITEQGTRNQVERRITHIQTDGVFKGAVCVGIAVPGVRVIQEGRVIPADGIPYDAEPGSEILPRFSPNEKEALNPYDDVPGQ